VLFSYPLAWAKDYPGAELPFSIEECMKVVVQLMGTQDEVTFDKSKIMLAGDSAGLEKGIFKKNNKISCKNVLF
jgi:acetyl esterase/lipase